MVLAASRMATISAWAEGSRSRRTRFWPRPTIQSKKQTTAPMGTSPSWAAMRASASAARIASSSLIMTDEDTAGLRGGHSTVGGQRRSEGGTGRLLLGHAVESAEAPDEIDRMDADDFAAGECGGDGVEGDAVVGIVKCGHEHDAVSDIEVGVAGGQALVAKYDRARQRELDEVELLAGGRARGFEAGEVVGERLVVGVAGVGFDDGKDGVGRGEARDVVDMAVGVVAGDATAEPDDLIDAEVVVERALELLAAHAGIALLDVAEQAFFRGEQSAGAVDVDGAAFEHRQMMGAVVELDGRLPGAHPEGFGGAGGNLIVEMPVVVFGPGVELPVGQGDVAFRVLDEDRAGVASPAAVGGPRVEGDAIQVDA